MLDPSSDSCTMIFLEHHSVPFGGHSGYQQTLQRIILFSDLAMKNFIKQVVKNCDICQRNKHENLHTPGLLQPLPVPDKAWEDISMDFIEGIPLVQSKSVILVVVDRLTKFSHFHTLKHPFTAQQVAHILFTEVLKLYGIS